MKTFYSSSGCCSALLRKHRRKFSVRLTPNCDAIYPLVRESEERGDVCDKCTKAHKRSISVRGSYQHNNRFSNMKSEKNHSIVITADLGLKQQCKESLS